MDNQPWVTQVRGLLDKAKPLDRSVISRHNGPLGTIKRKHLIQEAKLLASRYSLRDHLDAFVYATGHEALTGLALDQLEQLVDHLTALGVTIDNACDPRGAPPAR